VEDVDGIEDIEIASTPKASRNLPSRRGRGIVRDTGREEVLGTTRGSLFDGAFS
jgi:hypothetical protein